MIIYGIDPGATGAIAAIEQDDMHVVDVIDMPLFEHDLTWPVLRDFLESWPPKHVYLEKAQAMPKQGVTSMFHYGLGYGQVIGCLKAAGIPWTLVRPQTWKARELKDMDRGNKHSAVIRVNQLYPEQSLRMSQHGRADAILIARYGAGV